jgi:HEAT repeat protein
MTRRTPAWSNCVAVLLMSPIFGGSAQDAGGAADLVRQLGQFPPGIDPSYNSATLEPTPVEQRRAATWAKLRALADQAIPALQQGLSDDDVQIRRNVALYLLMEGMNIRQRPALNVKVFLPQLLAGLRDSDQRVKELAAQAVGNVGADAVVAVPDLLRLLDDPSSGLRNSACIGLAGIGPAARPALPALQLALSDPSNDVRRFAQRAIDLIAAKPDPR